MSNTEEILARARARSKDWAYQGAVTPAEAYELLKSELHIKLIDVRTTAER